MARTVNVALGGGGAKGFVHAGVLRELAEQEYEIKSIVGTSMGALIGAIFAYHRAIKHGDKPIHDAQIAAAEAVETVCLDTDFRDLRDLNVFSPLSRGLFRGRKIEEWLRTQLLGPGTGAPEGIRFPELPFDLTITATNALTGESLILNSERTPKLHVHLAVRGSISIQGIFADIHIDVEDKSVRCWDGGNTGNCRFDLAYRRHPEAITIASSLTYRGEPLSTDTSILASWTRPWKLSQHSISILMRQVEQVIWDNLPVDARGRVLLIRPPLGNVETVDFGINAIKKQELIRNGRMATKEALQCLVGTGS